MNKFYILSGIAIMIFFSACSPTPLVMTPKQIDSLAIKPNRMDKLFSPPKKGYARIIMYREDTFLGSGWFYSVMLKYNPILDKNGYWIKEREDRALCRIKSDSSCIVNIKAGKRVALSDWFSESGMISAGGTAASIAGGFIEYGIRQSEAEGMINKNAVIFTPKNQHIYCINFSSKNVFNPEEKEGYENGVFYIYYFRNAKDCLKEYKEVYKPKHREYQKKWFDKLVKKGDERAYKE